MKSAEVIAHLLQPGQRPEICQNIPTQVNPCCNNYEMWDVWLGSRQTFSFLDLYPLCPGSEHFLNWFPHPWWSEASTQVNRHRWDNWKKEQWEDECGNYCQLLLDIGNIFSARWFVKSVHTHVWKSSRYIKNQLTIKILASASNSEFPASWDSSELQMKFLEYLKVEMEFNFQMLSWKKLSILLCLG